MVETSGRGYVYLPAGWPMEKTVNGGEQAMNGCTSQVDRSSTYNTTFLAGSSSQIAEQIAGLENQMHRITDLCNVLAKKAECVMHPADRGLNPNPGQCRPLNNEFFPEKCRPLNNEFLTRPPDKQSDLVPLAENIYQLRTAATNRLNDLEELIGRIEL
jgi:hypothetical protein